MQEWQIFEIDGRSYYGFLPAGEVISHDENEAKLEAHDLAYPVDENECHSDVDVKPKEYAQTAKKRSERTLGDLYEVKLEGDLVTMEKVAENISESEAPEGAWMEPKEVKPIRLFEKSSENLFKCKVCAKVLNSLLAFRKHVAWAHKNKVCIEDNDTYLCAACDFSSTKKSAFLAHLEREHESRQRAALLYPCQVCGFVCTSKHSLQSHFIRKHTDSYDYPCKFCSKQFKVKGDLTTHVRFHHKEKPMICDLCGKSCRNSGSLYVHQKWAHYKPKYECHICKRRMVTQENLDHHLLLQHEQKERIMCAQCGKTFNKKDSFKRHMAIHTGQKPHCCPICKKCFARRSQLRQHLLIHTGKRPFVCDICGKAFTQKPGLICHRKTHPGKHPPLPVMPIGDIVNELAEMAQE